MVLYAETIETPHSDPQKDVSLSYFSFSKSNGRLESIDYTLRSTSFESRTWYLEAKLN